MQNRILLWLPVVLAAFTSCSKYGYVTLNYPTAPQVNLHEEIGSIALYNRSLTKEEDKKGKVFETIASGEILGSDEKASDESLRGVYDKMNGLYGIQLKIPKENKLEGTGTGQTPVQLSWQKVAEICNSTNTDALLVLESFDSNSDIMLTAASESVGAVLTGKIPDPTAPREVKVNVGCLWRLYDPETKEILDQFQQTSWLTFNTHTAIPPIDALPKTAYAAGEEYAFRFFPGNYSVKRRLYSKAKGPGKQEFKMGFRQSEVANWDKAIKTWNGVIEVAKIKTAGRACLNIAVAYEVLGNTDEALKWAQRAYEDYDDDLARTYAKILLRRKNLER